MLTYACVLLLFPVQGSAPVPSPVDVDVDVDVEETEQNGNKAYSVEDITRDGREIPCISIGYI